jgi:hypothetical protein
MSRNQPITNFFPRKVDTILTFSDIDNTKYELKFNENMTLSDVQNVLRDTNNRDFIVSSENLNKKIKELLPEDLTFKLFPYKAIVNFRFFNVYDRGIGQQEELLYETSKEMELNNLDGSLLEEVALRIWKELTDEQKKYTTTFFREGRIVVNSKPLPLEEKSKNLIEMPNVYSKLNNVIDVDSVVSNSYPKNIQQSFDDDEISNGITSESYDDDYFVPNPDEYEQDAYGVWVKKKELTGYGGKKKKRNTRKKRKNARKSKRRRRLY